MHVAPKRRYENQILLRRLKPKTGVIAEPIERARSGAGFARLFLKDLPAIRTTTTKSIPFARRGNRNERHRCI
jgi:hypothetical protein